MKTPENKLNLSLNKKTITKFNVAKSAEKGTTDTTSIMTITSIFR